MTTKVKIIVLIWLYTFAIGMIAGRYTFEQEEASKTPRFGTIEVGVDEVWCGSKVKLKGAKAKGVRLLRRKK